MVKRFSLLVLLLMSLAAVPVLADFVCDASVNRATVTSGGEVVLTVSARGDVGWSPQFQLPDLKDVRVYAGGTNQSMSMVNGATETSVSRTFYLKVTTNNDFTIGPIKITTDKGECTTKPIAIKVTAAADNTTWIPPSTTGNRTQRSNDPVPTASTNSSAGQPGDDIFVTLEADHTEAWVGQQIVLSFRYWRRIQPWNNPQYTPPRTEGFWREDLGSERNYRRVMQGRAYNVTEIRYAIFPTRVGNLIIEPAELAFPAGVFDRFFQSSRTRRGPNILRTDQVTIKVKGLPKPRPHGYSGVVASSLKLISQVDRDTVPRGEAIGLKVLLTADGFMKGFNGLTVEAPENTRMHDAGESFVTGVENDRLTGRVVVEKVVVPQEEGLLNIPAVELVWFDTGSGLFRTERTADWNLVVTPSDLPRAGDDESGFLRSEVARLGDDLAFIRQVPESLSRRLSPWTGSGLWWVLLILPVLGLGGFRFYLDRIAAERRDPAARKARRALATALARLGAGNTDPEAEPLSGLSRAVYGYFADCSGRPSASVGPAEIMDHCQVQGRSDTGRRLNDILTLCDAARYGQSDPQQTDEMVLEVSALLTRLDAGRVKGKVVAGLTQSLLLLMAGLTVVGAWDFAVPNAGMARAEESRPGADPVRIMAEGNQAYTEGRLQDAIEKYRQSIEMGVNDSVLHFNLGNSYARNGQLGEAVASYLRAQRLDPVDRDIRANLAWVRRHISDLELSDDSLPLFIAEFAAVVRSLTLDQWGGALLVLAWFTAGIVAWGWQRDGFSTELRRTLLTATGALVVVVCITAGRWYFEEVRQVAVVVVPEAEVRSGPADNFSVLFEVHDGLTLNIVESREGWVRVGLGGNWEGWVPAEAVVPVRRPST